MPVTNTPYGAQWRCDRKVKRKRGKDEVTETCNENGIAADRTKAQRALDQHIVRAHR